MIKQRFPNIEDQCSFELYKYEKALEYTQLNCHKHGAYDTKPNWVLTKGHHCYQCSEEKRSLRKNLGTEEFIRRSKTHFGETYDYSKARYKDCRSPVTIICREHGDFDIIAYYHSNGSQGCQKCGKESERKHYAEKHPNGASVYLVKLSNSTDIFHKIGLSSNLGKRVSELSRDSGCYVELVANFDFIDSMDAWDTEEILLNEFKDLSYEPQQTFSGYTECFKFDNINDIIKTISTIC